MTSLSTEEKERFLRALEEDRSFRYAVMSLLGLKDLIESHRRVEEALAKLTEVVEEVRERQQRLEERQQELEERFAKLEERQQKLEERQQRLEERLAKLEERQQRLEERLARLEERFAQLEERQQKLEERLIEVEERLRKVEEVLAMVVDRLTKLTESFEEYRRRQELMAAELAAVAESLYSRFAWEDIREEVLASGDKVVSRRRNARVDSEDVDLLVLTERRVYVVEVKVKPKHSHVGELIAKAEVVSRAFKGKEVIPVLAGAMIGSEVEKYALSKGVRVFSY